MIWLYNINKKIMKLLIKLHHWSWEILLIMMRMDF